MLIRFTIENWMSFKDETTFSMVATRERQHGERIPKVKKYGTRLLPVSAIFGGNASGKSNLFKALAFAKSLVVEGTNKASQAIGRIPFLLEKQAKERPSRFSFELLIEDHIYEYKFSVTNQAVVEERLIDMSPTGDRLLFHRQAGDPPTFAPKLPESDRLRFVHEGTRANQLFLTNSVSQNVTVFKSVHDWFQDTLELVDPEARYTQFQHFLEADHPLRDHMNALVPKLDSGVLRMGSEEVPLQRIVQDEATLARIRAGLDDGAGVLLESPDKQDRLFAMNRDGELVLSRLVSYHATMDGTEERFQMRQESDGTQRVIQLLPAFLHLSTDQAAKVYVIDELDRSLHTHLTRGLLEGYLDSCSESSRSQLLFTTHDFMLMDQDLLRRDEMWVTERDDRGITKLYSFSDFKDVRYDKDIRKSYLLGRMGGVPRLRLHGALIH